MSHRVRELNDQVVALQAQIEQGNGHRPADAG